jgi:hypothetical protein
MWNNVEELHGWLKKKRIKNLSVANFV